MPSFCQARVIGSRDFYHKYLIEALKKKKEKKRDGKNKTHNTDKRKR